MKPIGLRFNLLHQLGTWRVKHCSYVKGWQRRLVVKEYGISKLVRTYLELGNFFSLQFTISSRKPEGKVMSAYLTLHLLVCNIVISV